jgi:uncharacterized membrane protein YqjE
MADETVPGDREHGSHGSGGAVGGILRFIESRVALAAFEGRQAAGNYATAVVLAVSALVIALGTYALVVVCVVLILAHLAGLGALISVAIVAGIHILALAIVCWIAVRKITRPVFKHLFAQFEKDKEWLTNKTTRN